MIPIKPKNTRYIGYFLDTYNLHRLYTTSSKRWIERFDNEYCSWLESHLSTTQFWTILDYHWSCSCYIKCSLHQNCIISCDCRNICRENCGSCCCKWWFKHGRCCELCTHCSEKFIRYSWIICQCNSYTIWYCSWLKLTNQFELIWSNSEWCACQICHW